MAGDEGILRDVGPKEVDQAGELVKRVGVHNQAERLINQVSENFPPELVAAGSRRLLGGRSQTLDLKEVADAASEAFPDFTDLLSAKVRGSEERPEKIAVNVVFRTASGRSARGMLPYATLKKSQKAYDAGIQAGTIVTREDDPEAARKALEQAQRRIVELEAKKDGGAAPPEPEATPEPFEGYADVNASDLVERIEEGEFGLITLAAIIAAENERDRPRETVIDAAETKIGAAEAAVAEATEPEAAPAAQEPYEGYAGEDAKQRVAKIKSGDLTLPQLLAVKADQEAGDTQKTVLKAADEKITAAEEAIKTPDE